MVKTLEQTSPTKRMLLSSRKPAKRTLLAPEFKRPNDAIHYKNDRKQKKFGSTQKILDKKILGETKGFSGGQKKSRRDRKILGETKDSRGDRKILGETKRFSGRQNNSRGDKKILGETEKFSRTNDPSGPS